MIAAATQTAASQILTIGAWSPVRGATGPAWSSMPLNRPGTLGTVQTQRHLRHWKAPLSLVKDNHLAPTASQDGQGGATRELRPGA